MVGIHFATMLCSILVSVLAAATLAHGATVNIHPPSLEGKIVGGVNTTIEEHPYQVSIEFLGGHICGGSLIQSDIVLTAAHCLDLAVRYYSVRVGSTVMENGGQTAKAYRICNHPLFDGKDYDVSIIKLETPLELNSAVQTISLQSVGVPVPVGTKATITGWGTTEWEGEESTILQKVEVPKVSEEECKEKYPFSKITDRMTCYGWPEGGKDSCQGDSGGPLVANGKQVGVVSWGAKCATPGKPGVYTRLENDEIRAHIDRCIKRFED